MRANGYDEGQEDMIEVMTRIAHDLERLLLSVYICAGLLGGILFCIILRTLIGR
jgi:hypothetical protein